MCLVRDSTESLTGFRSGQQHHLLVEEPELGGIAQLLPKPHHEGMRILLAKTHNMPCDGKRTG